MTFPVYQTAAGIEYLRRPGPGRTLVCLHGIGSRAESFAPLLADLPADWDVLAWNAPGYGASQPLDGYWPDEAAYADALTGFVDALGLGRFALVGHSLGTLVAARFAAEHPDRLDALILAASATGHGQPVGGPLGDKGRARLSDLEEMGAEAFAAARAPRLLADPSGPARDAVIRHMAQITLPGYAQAVRMLASGQLEASLSRVVTPTALLWGTGDVITPLAQTERAAAALGGAPITQIRGVGHALHAEAPQAFAAALVAALHEMRTPA